MCLFTDIWLVVCPLKRGGGGGGNPPLWWDGLLRVSSRVHVDNINLNILMQKEKQYLKLLKRTSNKQYD